MLRLSIPAVVESLVFGHDGFSLFSAGSTDVLRHDLRDGTSFPLDSSGFRFHAVDLSPDGRHLVGGGDSLTVWETAEFTIVREFPGLWIRRAAFSADGATLFAHGYSELRRWRTDIWEALKSIRHPSRVVAGCGPVSAGRVVAGLCRRLAFSHDSGGSTLLVRDAATGRLRARIESPNRDVTAVALSPDGTLAVTANGAILRGWDIAAKRERWKVRPASYFVNELAFTTDGRHILTGGNDRAVRLLRAADGAQAAAYLWDVGRVTALAVSRDGTRAAVSGEDGGIVVWDLDA